MAEKPHQVALRYGALGLGAVAVPMLAHSLDFVAGLLNNAVLGFAVQGVSVGAVVLAGLGVFAVDKLAFQK